MNLLRKTLTRRAALSASTAGLALAALGLWSRSGAPAAGHPQAAVADALVATPTPTAAGSAAAAETAADPTAAPAAQAASRAAAAGPAPVVPAGGAGLFDVDPDQSGVNQDPHVDVATDIAALPLDLEF